MAGTGYWSIIVPESVTNICSNPSFETATTGWAAGAGHTLAQSTAQSFKGAYSAIVTIGGAGTPLATYAVSSLTSTGTYYLSAWIYVPVDWDGGNIRLGIASLTSAVATYNTIWTSGTSPYNLWYYIETKVVLDVDVTGTFQLERTGTANTGKVMYVDAVQFEEKSDHPTTYCDGEQAGCLWVGTRHLSTSERSGQSRAGGRVYNLDSLNAYVLQVSGDGMPPITNLTQGQALLSGALYQGEKVLPRSLVLIMDVIGTSRENLHSLRKTIINYIKSDTVGGYQPFKLRYSGAYSYRPVEIECVYAGGMGMGALKGFTETTSLALVAYDPYFYELGDYATHWGGYQSLTDTNYVLKKVDGVWAKLGTGFDGKPRCVAIAPNGTAYFGGNFQHANDVSVNYICYWDGTTFVPLMTGINPGLNNQVLDITFDAAGNLYACGDFTDTFGAAADTYLHIAKWTGAAWEALPNVAVNGFDDTAKQMTWGHDGKLYVTGEFHVATGTTVNHAAVWDGTVWASMEAAPAGLNDDGTSICTATNGDIIVGGKFSAAGGRTAYHVARWNGTLWSAMGGGFYTGDIYALLALANGEIYAGGTFTDGGYNTGNYLSIWNGTYWRGLPSEVNEAVRNLAQAPDQKIWVSGDFTAIRVNPNHPEPALNFGDLIGIWNGTSWSLPDFDLPGTPQQYRIAWNNVDDMFVSFGASGTAITSAAYTATNPGTTKAYPKITIKRSGGTMARIKWIKNETTGAELNFNEYGLLDGEILEIDTMPGQRSVVSSIFGNTWRALMQNSDLTDFFFLPGANVITAVYSDCRSTYDYSLCCVQETALGRRWSGGMSIAVWLADAAGTRIGVIDRFETLSWARVVNNSGWFEIVLNSDFDTTLLQIDGVIEIDRRPEGGTNVTEFAGFIRKIIYTTDAAGIDRITISGPDINDLMARRIVAYAAGTAYTTKTDNSDDMLKALARENLGALATDTDRNLTAAGMAFDIDQADGASLTNSCAWDALDGAVADLVKAASGAGTPIYWQILPTGSGSYKLFTNTGQPGQDRTGGNIIVFGVEYGNLENPKLVLDYTGEVTNVYAGGQTEGAIRDIVEVEDVNRSHRSIWSRREAFVDARNENTTSGITAKAYARLEAGRPKLLFTGTLLDTAQAVYGRDWGFGDRVFVTYRGAQYNALVKAVTGKITNLGQDIITAVCEVTDAITA